MKVNKMLLTQYAKKNIIFTIVAVLAAVIFIVPMYFYSNWSLSDIMLVPAIVYLGYISLRWITRLGTFDVFAYQMTNWASSTFRKGTPKKYKDAYAFKEQMTSKREDNKMVWIPWLVIGGICLILCIVFSFFPELGH